MIEVLFFGEYFIAFSARVGIHFDLGPDYLLQCVSWPGMGENGGEVTSLMS